MSRHSFETNDDAMDAYLDQKDNKSAYLRRLVEADMRGGKSVDYVGIQKQIETLERDAQDLAQREETKQQRAEELREFLETMEDRECAGLQDAKRKLSDTPREPDNPAIKKWAEKLGMTPEELCQELETHNNTPFMK